MVARVQRNGALVVSFLRDGAVPKEWPARDARQACLVVIAALADILGLYDGDQFVVRKADDDQPRPDWPEPSRSSHYGG
jgi:hypothetical protein